MSPPSEPRAPEAELAWFRRAGARPDEPGPLGLYIRGEWHDLEPILGDAAFDAIPLLRAGRLSRGGLLALSESCSSGTLLAQEPQFGLPIPHPRKILCIAKNYDAHAREMGGTAPTEPRWFGKLSEALLPCDGDVPLPEGVGQVDHEGELCLVLGKDGRDVPESEARELVAGVTLLNDVTARTMQKADRAEGHPWLRSKSFDGFAPVGPWVVPFEDVCPIGTPRSTPDLALSLEVNGERRQYARTSEMVHGVDRLIAYLSRHHTLRAGDLIATGTPAGIGALEEGDRVRLRLESFGTLEHGVARR